VTWFSVPDGIWGTTTHLAILGAVIVVAWPTRWPPL